MIKTKTIILNIVLSLFYLVSAQAQKSEVVKIRKEYTRLKSTISGLKEAEYTGALYCLHTEDNVYGASYPAVGTYNRQRWFYYEIRGNGEDPYEGTLVMVVEKTKRYGENKAYSEFMYQDGKLTFAYEKEFYDDNVEKRLYYYNGRFVQYTENNIQKAYADAEISIEKLLKKSEHLQQALKAIREE